MKRFLLALCLVLALPASALAGHSGEGADAPYMVQLASVKSAEAAENEWSRLQRLHGDLLGDLDLDLQRADLGERGIFFRIRTGPFPNAVTAKDMCWQIQAAKLNCLVVRRK
jgi:hypothetical protein